MSRDFKQEYQNYINEQTPDLWDRIEANLSAKEPVVKTSEDVTGQTSASVIDLQERKAKRRKAQNPFVTYGMTAVAAVLICIVALPFIRSGAGRMESADMAMDNGASMKYAMDVAEEGIIDAGIADQDVEMAAEEACEIPEPELYTYAETEEVAQIEAEPATSGTSMDSTKIAENAVESASGVSTPIEILSITTENGKDVYTVAIYEKVALVVLADEVSNVKKDAVENSENEVVDGAGTANVKLVVGNIYQVTLEKAEKGSAYDFVIVEIE